MTSIDDTWRAKYRASGTGESRMVQGWKQKVREAREWIRNHDRAEELKGVTFTPDEVVALLERCGYGG